MGFRQQFELEYAKKRKEEETRKWERKKLKRENPIAWHKENVAAMGDQSDALQAYVQQHFDQQRTLLNHEGEKGICNGGCAYENKKQKKRKREKRRGREWSRWASTKRTLQRWEMNLKNCRRTFSSTSTSSAHSSTTKERRITVVDCAGTSTTTSTS